MNITNQKSPDLSSQFIEKKLRELSTLAEMNKEIHATMNINKLLQILVEKAVIGVNFERGLIYLVEDEFLHCVAFLDRIKREQGSTIEDLVGFRMNETAAETLAVIDKKPIYIKDAQNDKRVSKKLLKITDTREYCVVPLIGRTGVLGVLTGDKFYSRDPILPEDIETLELFAGHIGLALETAKLYEEKERFSQRLEKKVQERTLELSQTNEQLSSKMKELSTLFEMAGLLSKSIRRDIVIYRILSLVKQLGHEKCVIHLLHKEKKSKIFRLGIDDQYEKIAGPLEKQFLSRAQKKTDPDLIYDLPSLLKESPERQFLIGNSLTTALLVPLRSKDRLIALMLVYGILKSKEELVPFFFAFSQQASIALENAIVFQEMVAQRDHMESLSKKLEQENISLREKIKSDLNRKFIVGKSHAMNELMDLVRRVVPTTTTVIIYGETGTGKELIANAIHEMGPRKDKPLIKVNCAAIPDDLLESELFGHEKGAFTGATDSRAGMFQLARNGTIFLDEIGDISLKTQTKLLRVLQEGEIQPLGSKSPFKVDVRVIAATNKDLQEKIEEKAFKPDLYYRLNVFPITLPLLKERIVDIQDLIDFFLNKYKHLRKGKVEIHWDVVDLFKKYSWPGNIRELENIIERLMIVARHDIITKDDLPKEFFDRQIDIGPVKPLNQALIDFKRDTVRQALSLSNGKKSQAAEMLGMPRSNFSRLLKQLGMR